MIAWNVWKWTMKERTLKHILLKSNYIFFINSEVPGVSISIFKNFFVSNQNHFFKVPGASIFFISSSHIFLSKISFNSKKWHLIFFLHNFHSQTNFLSFASLNWKDQLFSCLSVFALKKTCIFFPASKKKKKRKI